MRRTVPVAFLVPVLTAAFAASAVAGPPTLRGWPQNAPAGPLMQGPQGGVVVVAQDGFTYTGAAYRRDGRRLWSTVRTASCGNCDEGPQPVALQADGVYGPIGPEGDDVWALDAAGHVVAGCPGAVFADGTCVTGRAMRFDPTAPHPSVVAAAGPAPPWSVVDSTFVWQDEFDVPPMTVRDGAGTVYAAFDSPRSVVVGPVPGLLMTVDPVNHSVVRTRIGPRQVLAGFPSGVLVAEGDRIVSIGPDGVDRWSRTLSTSPEQVAIDPARDRVYIGPRLGSNPVVVSALTASTGATVWRTRGGDRARLMSVGPGGRVYLAVDATGRRAARGVRFTTGATVWEHRTSQPVLGVRELVNGTVAISAGARFAGTSGGRMAIIDPR